MNYLAAFLLFVSVNVNAAPIKNSPPVIDAYITVLDEAHLSSVRVNIEKSFDSDGKIERTEIDFGDGVVSAKSDLIHQYSLDGVYIISIKAWDKKGLMSQYSQSIDVSFR